MISKYLAVVYDLRTSEIIWNSKEVLPREPGTRRNIVGAKLSAAGDRVVLVDLGSAIYEYQIDGNE